MALIDDLRTRLAKYTTALDNALNAESYGIAGRQVSRARVADLQKEINILEARISRLDSGSGNSSVSAKFIPGTSGGVTTGDTEE